jgi:hypothetical protein
MPETGTYVYCLISADRRPVLRRRFDRLPGMGPLRLIEVDSHLWLAVADAPSDRYSERTINAKLSDIDWVSRAAVAHEAVVESFSSQPALLPMKLFTIFKSDARAVEQVRGDRRRIDALVKRVAHHLEWGVRVALDPKADRSERAGGQRRRAGKAGQRGEAKAGTRYLSEKKAQRDRVVELSTHAAETARDLYERLKGRAKMAKRRTDDDLPGQEGVLLLDAAFLVPRSRSSAFRSVVAREARRLDGAGYRIAVTGPWPPYSFVKD